jgi:hypothetical protein
MANPASRQARHPGHRKPRQKPKGIRQQSTTPGTQSTTTRGNDALAHDKPLSDAERAATDLARCGQLRAAGPARLRSAGTASLPHP